MKTLPAIALASLVVAAETSAAPRLRIMPPDRSTLAVGQRFDIRVETASAEGAPAGLRVFLDGREITAEDTDAVPASYLRRGVSLETAGEHVLRAETADGARAEVRLVADEWSRGRRGAPVAKNVILMLGDGMGTAQRTAARLVSRGLADGKPRGLLAMDTMPVTGQVMTSSLNAVVTDSSPGMSSYVTGVKGNNNQSGVFPDDTPGDFDNPRVEYFGEMLRRVRGRGFNVGIVSTADLTDSTPAGNAVHTADRSAGAGIAAAFFDERETNGVTVLMGGGARHFLPAGPGSARTDARHVAAEFESAGYTRVGTATEVRALLERPKAPERLFGLFAPHHLPVAFDKVGAGRYSQELAQEKNAALRDVPMLDDLARLALRSLADHSPRGFYLMIEGASIDKRAHDVDAERMVWDTIEFDRAVAVALEFARRTNSDADPANDTLVLVTADHETGGLAILGVGNERYSPWRVDAAVRDYAASLRFKPEQLLELVPNYEVDSLGYPVDPDPTRKLLLGWGAAPDRYENWVSNRIVVPAAQLKDGVAVANPRRDGPDEDSVNQTVDGRRVPGFLVSGVLENGQRASTPEQDCPGDTSSSPQTSSSHTAADVPLSAEGPGALQFTGTYDNTDVMLKLLRSATGAYPDPLARAPQRRGADSRASTKAGSGSK